MKKSTFLEHVETEATHIRENATNEEINKLDFDYLDPEHVEHCIYGQMTGKCDSERARELTPKSFRSTPALGYKESFTKWDKFRRQPTRSFGKFVGFTHLEVYIMLKGAKTEELLKYIKGVNKTFKA